MLFGVWSKNHSLNSVFKEALRQSWVCGWIFWRIPWHYVSPWHLSPRTSLSSSSMRVSLLSIAEDYKLTLNTGLNVVFCCMHSRIGRSCLQRRCIIMARYIHFFSQCTKILIVNFCILGCVCDTRLLTMWYFPLTIVLPTYFHITGVGYVRESSWVWLLPLPLNTCCTCNRLRHLAKWHKTAISCVQHQTRNLAKIIDGCLTPPNRKPHVNEFFWALSI